MLLVGSPGGTREGKRDRGPRLAGECGGRLPGRGSRRGRAGRPSGRGRQHRPGRAVEPADDDAAPDPRNLFHDDRPLRSRHDGPFGLRRPARGFARNGRERGRASCQQGENRSFRGAPAGSCRLSRNERGQRLGVGSSRLLARTHGKPGPRRQFGADPRPVPPRHGRAHRHGIERLAALRALGVRPCSVDGALAPRPRHRPASGEPAGPRRRKLQRGAPGLHGTRSRPALLARARSPHAHGERSRLGRGRLDAAYAHSDAHGDRNTHTHGDPHSHHHRNPDRDGDTHGDTDTDQHAHRHGHTHGDSAHPPRRRLPRRPRRSHPPRASLRRRRSPRRPRSHRLLP
ncbi:MAG: hypothetical protein KatS3mg076_3232 [Candidatus Binatia bacterium]|nr:MAG: hypothetical protein KatS3mg076_3232 [Candidatus Binatia bacterium]